VPNASDCRTGFSEKKKPIGQLLPLPDLDLLLSLIDGAHGAPVPPLPTPHSPPTGGWGEGGDGTPVPHLSCRHLLPFPPSLIFPWPLPPSSAAQSLSSASGFFGPPPGQQVPHPLFPSAPSGQIHQHKLKRLQPKQPIRGVYVWFCAHAPQPNNCRRVAAAWEGEGRAWLAVPRRLSTSRRSKKSTRPSVPV